ncbi:MAG: hypothetical protein JNL39_03165 [Opitutaceae bacterium]|nr:hypothetical protein [Opitutaceae bacterium]
MPAVVLKFLGWLAQKFGVAALIVLVVLAVGGLWLFIQEERAHELSRAEKLVRAVAERDRLLAVQADVARRLETLRADIEKQRERAKQAAKVVATLRELESWWERWFGNRQQQSANAEQIERMEKTRKDALGLVDDFQRAVTKTVFEKDGVDLAVRRVNGEVALLEETRSKARHYVVAAWDRWKWWLGWALAGYFFGPTLWALALYFVAAPLMARGRSIRLGPEPAALPEVGESRVSIEARLQPGDILRIKEKFLQASDEGVAKHTRFVLDWRIPFTSLACGLVELVELRHGRADGEARVTLSNGADPHLEMAQITVPAGASLVLRPSFLAGVVQREGESLAIRRHWRIFRWQSWISGQFRFFEFVGPCRLYVAGSRGVRAEVLAEREGASAPARRTNQDATIGFTPNLDYRPVRAESFWHYYRGMNPLFDDLFAGRGLFVLQETATEGSAARAAGFWSTVWNGVLKVFGL